MTSNKKISYLWLAVLIISVFGLIVFGVQVITPYSLQKYVLDNLSADGEIESFTLGLYAKLRRASIILGIVMLFLTSYFIIFRESATKVISGSLIFIQKTLQQIKIDFFIILKGLVPKKDHAGLFLALIVITMLGAFFRYAYLWRPMAHDEAYTFMAFASRGLRFVLTDYHLPNNHVFHTVWVHVFYRLLGDSPAVIRLTAYLAGVLIVPAVFFVGRSFYGWRIGLTSASVLASLPIMIDYSTNARGYTLITLFALVIVIIAGYITDHRNLFAWFLLIIFSSLGMYTNPTMFYPLGMIFTWLLLSHLIGDTNSEYGKQFLGYLLLAGVGILLVTFLLYLPVILTSGLESLIGNRMVSSLSWSAFSQSILPRIRNTWQEWNRDVPPVVSLIGLIGLLASFLVPKLPGNKRVPLILAGFLWIAAALILQRVAPWPRIWLFLLPFFVIWSTAGIFGLISIPVHRLQKPDLVLTGVMALWVGALLLVGMVRTYPQYTLKLSARGELEQVADYLKDRLEEGDRIVATSPDRVILDYYLLRRNLGRDFSKLGEGEDISRVIVVVNMAYGQTLESVLEARSFLDDVQLDTAEEIYRSRRFILYQLSGNWSSSGAIGPILQQSGLIVPQEFERSSTVLRILTNPGR